jgi:uncharacterized membrane protein YgcG
MIKLSQLLIIFLACGAIASAQSTQETTFAGQPATLLSNDKLQVTVMTQGGAIASVVLADDAKKQNPMWSGGAARPGSTFTGILGHFVAVDGFGQPSAEERAAGLPQHGEAHTTKLMVTSSKDGDSTALSLTGNLPIVQENFTRTFHIVPGENVVYVDSMLENLLGFDRPVTWAEHATVQAPFVKPGVASVWVSGSRSQTRPTTIAPMVPPLPSSTTPSPASQGGQGGGQGQGGQGQGRGAAGQGGPGGGGGGGRGGPPRLANGVDFTYPMAPTPDGKQIDMTTFPDDPPQGDHIATLFDPSRTLEWVATVNTEQGMIYGYLLRRQDYPWIQMWGQYPSLDGLVKGMEFSTQPYDINKSTVIDAGPMFGTPTFRWLRAKGKLETHFLFYYARIPAGFKKIDDVRLENKQIIIEDRTNHKTLTLAASRGL